MAMRIFILLTFFVSFASAAFAADMQKPTFDDLLQRLKQHPEIESYATRAES